MHFFHNLPVVKTAAAIIKKQILDAIPTDKKYITVYLPSYCEPQLKDIFTAIPDYQFQVFTKEISSPKKAGNIVFLPVDKKMFNESLIHCTGIITGGGFETPAEAIHLGKKILSVPIRGQYEQVCNCAALKQMGISCREVIEPGFKNEFYTWLNQAATVKADYSKSIEESLDYLFRLHNKTDKKVMHTAELEQV